MPSFWIQVVPKFNDWKGERREILYSDSVIQGRRPCEGRGRDWGYAATS